MVVEGYNRLNFNPPTISLALHPPSTLPPATRNGALPPNALNSPDASNSGNIPVWILHLLIYPHIYRLLIRYCTWVVVLGSTPNAVVSVPRTCIGIGGLGYTEFFSGSEIRV